METRAVDKWLPCIKQLDYEWDKDSDSVDISFSGGHFVVHKDAAVPASTKIPATG